MKGAPRLPARPGEDPLPRQRVEALLETLERLPTVANKEACERAERDLAAINAEILTKLKTGKFLADESGDKALHRVSERIVFSAEGDFKFVVDKDDNPIIYRFDITKEDVRFSSVSGSYSSLILRQNEPPLAITIKARRVTKLTSEGVETIENEGMNTADEVQAMFNDLSGGMEHFESTEELRRFVIKDARPDIEKAVKAKMAEQRDSGDLGLTEREMFLLETAKYQGMTPSELRAAWAERHSGDNLRPWPFGRKKPKLKTVPPHMDLPDKFEASDIPQKPKKRVMLPHSDYLEFLQSCLAAARELNIFLEQYESDRGMPLRGDKRPVN